MAQPAKFNFDLDLGKATHNSQLIEDRELDQLLAKARAEGYAQGLAEGQESAQTIALQQMVVAAEQLAQQATEFATAMDLAQKEHIATAAQLGKTVGKKLAAHLLAAQPTAEIDALLADCLANLGTVGHLAIRCNEVLSDEVKQIAERHAANAGFAGRLIILGEPEIPLGDCRVEWSDGGLVREFATISAQIDEKIGQFVLAKTGHSPQPEPELEPETTNSTPDLSAPDMPLDNELIGEEEQ